MKKFLFVESYPQVMFGQQRTLLSLLDACPAAGIKPTVAATAEGPFTEEVRRHFIPVGLFPYPDSLAAYGGAIYGYKGFRFLWMIRQWANYVWRLRSELKALKLDGVYCNDMRGILTAGIAARLGGIPVLTWDKLDKPHGWMDHLQLWIVSLNLVISDSVRVKYPAWQQKFFRRKIKKVYNGADLSRFEGGRDIRASLPGETGDVLVGIVGTITERKGHDRVLDAWGDLIREYPRLRLLVAGEGSGTPGDEVYGESLKKPGHPRVHFLGMRRDIPDLMASLDVLLVPSRHEGMGQVTVEAMAAGKPVIGSDAGGIPEVVRDGETGLIVPGNNPEGWKAAIGRLASSPELRAQMGQAGRKRVEAEFNRPVQMRKVLDLLVEMTHGR